MNLAEGLRMTPEERIEWARKKSAVIDAAREVSKVVHATSGGSGGRQWFKELADLLDAVEALDGPVER